MERIQMTQLLVLGCKLQGKSAPTSKGATNIERQSGWGSLSIDVLHCGRLRIR